MIRKRFNTITGFESQAFRGAFKSITRWRLAAVMAVLGDNCQDEQPGAPAFLSPVEERQKKIWEPFEKTSMIS
jgi:hypothetical protein